jgi:hypothetical protein
MKIAVIHNNDCPYIIFIINSLDTLTFKAAVVTICTIGWPDTPKLYILSTQCICIFLIFLTVNSYCFPKQPFG